MTQDCDWCKKPVKGDFTTHEGVVRHIRCLRKWFEAQPGFIAWVKPQPSEDQPHG